jgi:tetratricopeptide (TPR) repeat protein
VIHLLRAAGGWECGDLNALSAEEVWLPSARALVHIGETKAAANIVQAFLKRNTSNDGAYALLLDLDEATALAHLDELIASDRWEERPLIWKAELLRRKGRLEEAEQIARQALALDPTDGDQKTDARVQGYATLAAVLADRGKQDDAKFFRNVVESVRRAERGDRLRDAGLYEQAREQYEKAESAFADAYCVQWRLAERLHAQGKIAEAEKHYEIAFERMPSQFGRVAQVCFGCERVFGNESSRGAADRVLSRLCAETNARPQALLILARLRIEQERLTEAWTLLQRAVTLDPEHLDAWKELQTLAPVVNAPAEQRRQIVAR